MKRFMSLMLIFIYLFSNQPTMSAAGTSTAGDPSVYDAIHDGGKSTPPKAEKIEDSGSSAIFPLFIKFVFSFILVIGLLFLFIRFLSKRGRLMQSSGPVLPLGGHSLGNNRSLQVVLIGQTIYILGVGETITLIRSINQGEEYQHLLEGFETQADPLQVKWLGGETRFNWLSTFQKQIQKLKKGNQGE
ncbi:flagellar biosynthetic protein FliO [Neobacillus citreus]|uniref:Flagellar biosynthetic protein FliO n=1 Tax=Neobacillus citreus TaxID=2833578 RepID=A0A942SUV1_9BACI|nr:flagellar biosynthetic protein FliO [Neobacillus citreus]MCH6266817.1 flagellar biosynthetic protein FliO [Neobacillus citreus]